MNALKARLWKVLDGFFYFFHLCIVAFILCGWVFPQIRLAHLVFVVLTLASWRVLGYCPLTSWHWKIKAALGQPAPKGAFIHSLAQRISRRPLDGTRVNARVEALTLFLALLSLAFNLSDWILRAP